MTSLPGYVFKAEVLGPEEIPILTEPEEIVSNPKMAALKVMVHGHREDVRQIFVKGVEALPDDYALEYYDHVRRMTAEPVSRILEELMKKTTIYSDIAREHEAIGEAIGEARGEAKALLLMLTTRGIEVPEEMRARISGCQDLGQLETWVRRAMTARSVEELFR